MITFSAGFYVCLALLIIRCTRGDKGVVCVIKSCLVTGRRLLCDFKPFVMLNNDTTTFGWFPRHLLSKVLAPPPSRKEPTKTCELTIIDLYEFQNGVNPQFAMLQKPKLFALEADDEEKPFNDHPSIRSSTKTFLQQDNDLPQNKYLNENFHSMAQRMLLKRTTPSLWAIDVNEACDIEPTATGHWPHV